MPCVRECTYRCLTETGRDIELTLLQSEQVERNPCSASVRDPQLGSCQLIRERAIPGSIREVAGISVAGALVGGGFGLFFFGPGGALLGAAAGAVVGRVLGILDSKCP